MKVTRTTDVGSAEKAEGAKRPTKTDGEFGRVFQDELNHLTSANQAVVRLEPGLSPLPTAPVASLGLEKVRSKDPAKVEQTIAATIDRLDQVGQLLHDVRVTPRTVNDAIHELTTQAEELRHATKALPADHPLQQIATEVSVLATVESIKWNRGDYL
jgi:hypothetical protein